MPSHTYFWVGRYRDAARANLDAIAADEAWIRQAGWSKPDWDLDYFGHNVRFALGGALMAGDADAALIIADRYGQAPASEIANAWGQSGVGAAWFAWGRHGDPAAVLAMPMPPADKPFLVAMHHYGRGEALARQGDARGARAEAARIRPSGHSMLRTQMAIAREVLLGRADMLDGRYMSAAGHFRKAAARQEKVFGNHGDPPVWWYPPRRSLAAALLAAGRPNPALEEARAVLRYWKDDPMALVVVARAEAEMGRREASEAAMVKARAGWAGGDPATIAVAAI
jgi:hypothetical protein